MEKPADAGASSRSASRTRKSRMPSTGNLRESARHGMGNPLPDNKGNRIIVRRAAVLGQFVFGARVAGRGARGAGRGARGAGRDSGVAVAEGGGLDPVL